MDARDVPKRGENLMLGNIRNFAGLMTVFPAQSGNTVARLRVWPGLMRDSPSLCQGLHKQRFLPYVSGLRWRSASDAYDRFGRPATPLRPCREDEWFGYWPCCGMASRNG